MHKVLVIDDEKPTLKMFALFLEAYGYQVLLAENGSTGLDVVRREKPHIVFTDIKMPGMDGIEVLRNIKSIDVAIEVIVMTGHGDMDLAVQALNLDATDFINKPIHRTALEAALGRAEERIKLSKNQESQILPGEKRGVKVLMIRGNITSQSEQELTRVYRQAAGQGAAPLLIRFDEASSINGAGIAALIQLLSESRTHRQKVAITGISENFEQIFEMVGITRYAKTFEGEEAALQYLIDFGF